MKKAIMDEENKLRADIIELQEKVKSLQALIAEQQSTIVATYATKTYVSTYIEHMLGELMPIHDPWTADSLITGYIPLNIEKVLRHFRNIGGSYNTVDFTSILLAYDESARKGNINPYFAVAQMVKETDWTRSWWSQRPRRNPAGIGVTGEKSNEQQDRNSWALREDGVWVKGYSFPSWQVSVQAHIGHLLTYIYKPKDVTTEQQYLIDHDPRSKFVPEKTRGTVKKLSDLDGRWAVPGIGYGKSIATIANALKK